MVKEDLFLSVKEHKLIKKYKSNLERWYGVAIHVPKFDKSCSRKDLIFGWISGIQENIQGVKSFLSQKMSRSTKSSEWKYPDGITLITLSDSEDESSESDDSICVKNSTNCPESNVDSLAIPLDESICIIENSINPENSQTFQNEMNSVDSIVSPSDSILIIDSPCSVKTPEVCRGVPDRKQKTFAKENKKNKYKVKRTPFLPSSSSAEDIKICEVSSTTEESNIKLCREYEKTSTTPILKPELDLEFIALCDDNNTRERVPRKRKMSPVTVNEDIIVLDTPEVKKTVPAANRRLRPIVIDGSNVAREHGKVNGVFSSKGIKLCVDYFLNRGHTQVTAFVPIFRRHADRRKFYPTTDQQILEELAMKQHVVFTPSRRLNGQNISSYDDRFVVQLAEKNGGVIVSNDNFKDLLLESESFKKVIEERLLMFCFVGDEFMVPDDPLGRNGPRLNDYLSFPPEENKD